MDLFEDFETLLKEYDKDFITVEMENDELVVERKNISQIKTVYEW